MITPTKKQIEGLSAILNYNIVLLDGAVRSGKTYTALWAIPLLVEKHWDNNILLSAKTLSNIERNILTPLRKMFGEKNIGRIKDKKDVVIFGKKVWLIAFNNEASYERLQGTSLGCAIVDEMVLCPQSFWNMLLSRLDVEDFNLVGSCNPSNAAHYIKKYIDDPNIPSKKNIHWTLDDNPHLPKTVIENLKASYKGSPTFYKRYILGEWVSNEGLACFAFDRNIHLVDKSDGAVKNHIRQAQSIFIGIDGATNNDKTSCVPGIFNRNDDLMILKRFNHNPKTSKPISNVEVVELIDKYINELFATHSILEYIDKIMVVDCAAADLIIQLGYKFKPKGWTIIALTKKSIRRTLEIMNNSFSRNKVKVVEYGENDWDYLQRREGEQDYLIDELETVELKENEEDKVKLNPKYPNDSFDALRYLISYYFKVEDMTEGEE